MKRSEALKIISKELESLASSKEVLDAHGFLFIAEKMLKMEPPIIEDKSFQLLENGEMTYAVHEWEPEDGRQQE